MIPTPVHDAPAPAPRYSRSMRSTRLLLAASLLTLSLASLSGCDGGLQATTDPCALDPDPGPCEAAFPKAFFDPTDGVCKEFIWGGCEGEVPFETIEECQQSCLSR